MARQPPQPSLESLPDASPWEAYIGGKSCFLSSTNVPANDSYKNQSTAKSGKLNIEKDGVTKGKKLTSSRSAKVIYPEKFMPAPPPQENPTQEVAQLAGLLMDFQREKGISMAELRNLLKIVLSHLPEAEYGSTPVGGTDHEPFPTTWDEAKAQVPGLMRWDDAKAANPSLTITVHLQDKQNGYGRWATVEPGLPRRHLMTVFEDKPAYDALNIFLRRHSMPPGLHLPKKKEITDRLVAETDDPGTRPARVDWAIRAREAYRRKVENLR